MNFFQYLILQLLFLFNTNLSVQSEGSLRLRGSRLGRVDHQGGQSDWPRQRRFGSLPPSPQFFPPQMRAGGGRGRWEGKKGFSRAPTSRKSERSSTFVQKVWDEYNLLVAGISCQQENVISWRNCDCAGNNEENASVMIVTIVIANLFKEDVTKWQPKIYNTDFY